MSLISDTPRVKKGSWKEYINTHPAPSPFKYVDEDPDVVKLRSVSISAYGLMPQLITVATIKVVKIVTIDPLKSALDKLLDREGAKLIGEQTKSELFNEQSVALVYFTILLNLSLLIDLFFRELYAENVLQPVRRFLNVHCSELFEHEVLKAANYRFIIRPQQKQVTGVHNNCYNLRQAHSAV